MPFTASSEHISFFSERHFIEFEALFSAAQMEQLKHTLEKALVRKAKTGHPSGYDLHLVDSEIKKFSHKKNLASLAAQLSGVNTIRFGFSYYWQAPMPLPGSDAQPLQQTSCLSPLAGALLLPLTPHTSSLPFPKKLGDGLFVSPALSIPWSQLSSLPGFAFFLIVFATAKTRFKADTQDPLASELKRCGYAFNDLLKDPLHPLLLRPSHNSI